jgi:hypothetical protein
MATYWTLGCVAADPHGIAAFWASALGYVAEPGYDNPDGASIIDPDGVGSAISFLRVPEGETAKNRMHIDIRAVVTTMSPRPTSESGHSAATGVGLRHGHGCG